MFNARYPTDNIMEAIRENNLEEVKRHIKETKGCASAAVRGTTPLHLAVSMRESNPEILDALIMAGAKVNQIDSTGNTPLHLAAVNKNKTAISYLIKYGADHLPNRSGQTPIVRIDELLKNSKDSGSKMSDKSSSEYVEIIELITASARAQKAKAIEAIETEEKVIEQQIEDATPQYQQAQTFETNVPDTKKADVIPNIDEIEELSAEIGPEYKEVTDEEFDEIMGVVAEAQQYREEKERKEQQEELDRLLQDLHEAEAQKEAENKSNPISKWLGTHSDKPHDQAIDRKALENICKELGFPKNEFPELHRILISSETEVRAKHQRHPITMGKLNNYLQQIYAATDEFALSSALRKLGIHRSKMPKGQFDLLLEANQERQRGFINQANELIEKHPNMQENIDRLRNGSETGMEFSQREKNQRNNIAQEEAKKIHTKEFLAKISELVATLPPTSGTKKIYEKILNNSNISDSEKFNQIKRAAENRIKSVAHQNSTLFRNIDDSRSIHKALAVIDNNKPYDDSPFKITADSLIQQKKERAEVLTKKLRDIGLIDEPTKAPPSPRRK